MTRNNEGYDRCRSDESNIDSISVCTSEIQDGGDAAADDSDHRNVKHWRTDPSRTHHEDGTKAGGLSTFHSTLTCTRT